MLKKYGHAILIIDAQYDFCHPDGALFVPGADNDMKRLSEFIVRNADALDYVCVTLDNHPVHDISHPLFWEDSFGKHPSPFTQITCKDIHNGQWKPRFHIQEAIAYIESLETQGEFPHFIWPEHCLLGSLGASLDANLFEALRVWAKLGKDYEAVRKGMYPLTEHFGIFMAQIPEKTVPSTQLNQELIKTLNQYATVYLAGEAKSHCVATSLKQIMKYAPELAQKVVVLEDCMSDVPNMEHLGEPIYQEAKQKGIRFAHAKDIVL